MAYRGWLALNGAEFANTARVVSHLGRATPTSDLGMWGSVQIDCAPVEVPDHPGLSEMNDQQVEVSEGLWTPAPGARIFGPGLFVHDECWGEIASCSACGVEVEYDDSWPGQRE